MKTVTFVEEGHRYLLHEDGKYVRDLPSVTTRIKAAGMMPDWYKNLDPWYAERGRKVHLACHYLDQGDLDEETVDPEIKSRVEAWKLFKDAFDAKVLESELVVWDDETAGTIDKIVEDPTGIWILDLKGEHAEDFHSVQTYGYKTLAPEKYRNARRGAVYLQRNGIPKFDIHRYDKEDAERWAKALQARTHEAEKNLSR